MDDDEDDVFGNSSYCWRSSFRQVKQEDKATQTPSHSQAQCNSMLPCGVREDPRRLFYGRAALLLCSPGLSLRPRGEAVLEEEPWRMEQPDQEPALAMEAQIGQKLQMIGDQFHQEHMLYQQNQRNQQPLWLQLALAIYSHLFEQEFVFHGGRNDQR
ncbi:BCL2 modifying factor 1 [Chanos chanos]|uniref:BCL2 modifying factor 1 n=1 Tax=Chanos chanos TaxID=29144 RepID=A0A6J2WIY1_CHACN|nr:bcl-2-modifying factor [Chanos chanos]